MAEAENTSGTESKEISSFLEKFKFESEEQAIEVFSKYKDDIKALKPKAGEVDNLRSEIEAYKAKEEETRLSKLGEVERLKEELGERDKAAVEYAKTLKDMEKKIVFKEVMFDHMKDKALSKTRSKLYEVAVKSNDWTTAEELQEILTGVDSELESDLESASIKLPLPGDGNGSSRTEGTKYDDNYFANLRSKVNNSR